jgi:hypothetical protein
MKRLILLVLPSICWTASAWAQADCNPRQDRCNPGYRVDISGDQTACRACPANSVSDGCTLSCSQCGPGTKPSSNHASCEAIPTCQASVTAAKLSADSTGPSPLMETSFKGNIHNPAGAAWFTPPPPVTLRQFATQDTCEEYSTFGWTWNAVSTTGTWVGPPGQAVQCVYKLTTKKTGQCSGFTGKFTITCSGSSCKF